MVIAGLPGVITVPAVSSPSPVAVLPPSPPAATSKSAGVPIGAVAGGIAGGAVVIGEPGPCLPSLHMLPHRLSTLFACVISISVCMRHECSCFNMASASWMTKHRCLHACELRTHGHCKPFPVLPACVAAGDLLVLTLTELIMVLVLL